MSQVLGDPSDDPTDDPTGGPTADLTADLTGPALRDIADVPAIEVITTTALHLMSAAAVKCGLGADEADARHQDLDEVEVRLLCQTKRVLDAHDADLLAVGANQAHFRDPDALVDARLADVVLLSFEK
jgi:hypothetical protein